MNLAGAGDWNCGSGKASVAGRSRRDETRCLIACSVGRKAGNSFLPPTEGCQRSDSAIARIQRSRMHPHIELTIVKIKLLVIIL